jgi:hypothetical protein
MTLEQTAGVAFFLAAAGFIVRYALLNPDVGLWPKVDGPTLCWRFRVRKREVCICLLSWDIVLRTSLLVLGAILGARGWHLTAGDGRTDTTGALAAWALAFHSLIFAANLLRQRQPLWLTRMLCWLRLSILKGEPPPARVVDDLNAMVGAPAVYDGKAPPPDV